MLLVSVGNSWVFLSPSCSEDFGNSSVSPGLENSENFWDVDAKHKFLCWLTELIHSSLETPFSSKFQY